MPANLSKRVVPMDSSSYCSAPPLTISSRVLLPPRPTRAEEARCPCAPLSAVKAEVRELEVDSVKFVVDDQFVDVKLDVKVRIDPRQLTARVAAISIRQPDLEASMSSREDRHSSFRTQPPCRVPSSQLGPADPP